MGRMEWLLLAISVGLVLACGVFGAAEYSFVAVDRATVEKAAAEGDRQAQGVRPRCGACPPSSPVRRWA